MAVTELAQLRLAPGASLQDSSLRAKLRKATQAMEAFDGHRFYWYNQSEDASVLYIVGSWESAHRHHQEWLPSAANQELLEMLSGHVVVDWMFDVHVAPQELPLCAPVMVIARHFIMPQRRNDLESNMWSAQYRVAKPTAPRNVAGGWRIERESSEQDEWVSFEGRSDVGRQSEVAETEDAKEVAMVKKYSTDVEVKHATRMEL